MSNQTMNINELKLDIENFMKMVQTFHSIVPPGFE